MPWSPLLGLGCKSTSIVLGMQHVFLNPTCTGGSDRSPAQPLSSSLLLVLPVLRNELASLCPRREQLMLLNLRHLPKSPASLY